MKFEFATAARIVFGSGTFRQIGLLVKEQGSRALVVTGANPNRAEPLLNLLHENGVNAIGFPTSGEPKVETVVQGVSLAKRERCDCVVSFGGGSAIDAGKAIAAMLTNEGELLDYLEIIGHGEALAKAAAPFIAVPTTAGTGAEVTRNAVLASPEHRVKVSLRSPLMLPKIAVVDPDLTLDLPPALSASTGMDALTQVIEPFVCTRANPMTDGFCREGIRRAAKSLRKAVLENGRDFAAREDMALASLFGGLALANAGLGAVHGFAGPIGGMFPAPHGAVCAALLPHVMEINVRALRERDPNGEALRRYCEVAELLSGDDRATPEDAAAWTRRLVKDLKIPRLGAYGVAASHISEIVSKAANASSMKPNPVDLTPAELAEILERAI